MPRTAISVLVAAAVALNHGSAWACTTCRPAVKAGVYDQNFAGTLMVLLLPLGVLALVGAGLYFFADRLFGFAPATVSAVTQAPPLGSTRTPEGTKT